METRQLRTQTPNPKDQDPIKPNQLISSVPTRRRTKPSMSLKALVARVLTCHLLKMIVKHIVGSGVCNTLIIY